MEFLNYINVITHNDASNPSKSIVSPSYNSRSRVDSLFMQTDNNCHQKLPQTINKRQLNDIAVKPFMVSEEDQNKELDLNETERKLL